MILGSIKSIEDIVIEKLGEGSTSVKALWTDINQVEPTSIQAVYKSLRKLLKDGVIVKNHSKVALNQEWVNKVGRLLNSSTSDIQLEDKEAVTYKFKGLSQLDAYWKHAVINFIKTLKGPVFHSEPHEMWIHLEDRYESQMEYINSFAKDKRLCFLVFGGTTAMDREYKKTYQNEYLQIDLQDKPNFIKRDKFLTIIGDVLITTIISKELSERIDKVYENTPKEDSEFPTKIREAFKNPGSVKLKIERNNQKAKQLRKKLSKNFYISKEIAREYNLF